MKQLFCLYITTIIEYEYESTAKYFFFTQEQLDEFKSEYIKKNTQSDGNYIPNITSIDFEQELIDLTRLKYLATIADIEKLTGYNIDISKYFK